MKTFKTSVKIGFLLLLTLASLVAIGQKDDKQLSLDFTGCLKNKQYHQAYIMADSTLMRHLSEEKFSATFAGVNKQLGGLDTYSFEKETSSSGKTLIVVLCNFHNATVGLQITFDAAQKICGVFIVPAEKADAPKYSPPSYDSSKCYKEHEINVVTGKYKMPGILTIPHNVKNPPVIILVHGSGPNDMDEAIGPNKTFRDLAVGLASKGIATIRYDKRTKVYGGSSFDDPHNFTVKDETIDDAISAVNLVSSLDSFHLDSTRIYLLGHSLGAMLAPRIANECKKIKGIIMLAGPARSLFDLIIEQSKYQASLDTTNDPDVKQRVNDEIKKCEFAKSGNLKPSTPDSLLPFGIIAPYCIDLDRYNQVKTAEELSSPILIMQGENDCQVNMEDFKIWDQALGKRKNVALKSYPKLNHLFFECENKNTGKEYEKPSHVPFYVINDIAGWVNKN
jgi:dienelactone hydrolase